MDRWSRRAVLGLMLASGSSLVSPAWASATPQPVAGLEQRAGGRLGVFALETATGRVLHHRADERFAMCSTFKWALAAAVLEQVDRGALLLEQPIRYREADLLEYAPVTRAHVGDGQMTVEALAQSAVTVSDNTAANQLLACLGGPAGLTRFFRACGDEVTRLDRTEPALNENLPGDHRDTTTPRAMVATMRAVLTGPVLSEASRERLLGWLVACETGRSRLRAGFPAGWRAGDKTGSGANGACNDIALAWAPGRGAPWLIASYLSGSAAPQAELNQVHAAVARLVSATWAR